MIDVAKDVVNPRWSQSEQEYRSSRKFNAGDVIAVGLYMNNGGLDIPEMMAKNVKISTSITSEKASQHKITTLFTGDNIAPLFGEVKIETLPDEYLEVIPKSGYMYTNEGSVILDQQGIELANTTFTLGDLDPGFNYALFFTFKIRVSKRT